MKNFKQSIFAGIFSIFTIGVLTILTYKTEYGVFLIASFGSSMVYYTVILKVNMTSFFFFKFGSFAFIHFNSYRSRIWSKFNDYTKCNSSACRRKSYNRNYRQCIFDYILNPIITGSIIILILE